jgi:hypothetical protein
MQEVQRHLTDTRTAFVAQCRRRDDLVAGIEQRLKIRNDLEYEKFFFKYHAQLNEEEKFDSVEELVKQVKALGKTIKTKTLKTWIAEILRSPNNASKRSVCWMWILRMRHY